MPELLCACVGMWMCDCTPLLKGPDVMYCFCKA